MTLTLGTFVNLLLARLQEEQVAFQLRDHRPWCVLFYELKRALKREGRPAFFDHLTFDWDGPAPKCRELSEYLDGLRSTGTVLYLSRFDAHKLDPEDQAQWLCELQLLDAETRVFLEEALAMAREEFTKQAMS